MLLLVSITIITNNGSRINLDNKLAHQSKFLLKKIDFVTSEIGRTESIDFLMNIEKKVVKDLLHLLLYDGLR